MQSAAAIGLVRPCAARPVLKNPSPAAGVRLPAARAGTLRLSNAAPRAGLVAAAAGLGRIGLVPASPDQEKRRSLVVAAAAAASGKAEEPAAEEGGTALAKTLQLGVFFGLWYLFNIYFNIYNKQVSSQHRFPFCCTEKRLPLLVPCIPFKPERLRSDQLAWRIREIR
jgi:solute carrier family 35 protein E1